MKYQCNVCAKIYTDRQDAVNCHPDINEIPDKQDAQAGMDSLVDPLLKSTKELIRILKAQNDTTLNKSS